MGNFITTELLIQSVYKNTHTDNLKGKVIHLQTELDYAALGRRIKKTRQAKGLTQSNLADKVFCNTSHISNIENNHTKVSLNSLLAISNALDTSVDSLLSDQFKNPTSALDVSLVKKFNKLTPEKKRIAINILDVL